VIHAAAVSDYGVDSITVPGGVVPAGSDLKIGSGHSPLLRLRPNPRLVDGLRALSPSPFQLVAFKLTSGASPEETTAAIAGLFAHSGADYVVHNDLAARAGGAFPATIHRADGAAVMHCHDRGPLAAALAQLLENPNQPLPCS
jgi:phosphopantothenoylcysteine decarboxylase/phosphopantothenate--cysteine ligase